MVSLALVLVVVTVVAVVVVEAEVGQCSVDHQRLALDTQTRHSCQPRAEVVEVEVPLGAMEVRPSHVSVARCSGSCPANPGLSCLPLNSRMRAVDVMAVTPSYSTGAWQTDCSVQQVREDISCSCGCHLGPHDCTAPDQIFLPHQCRCLCQNLVARSSCLAAGRTWQASSCSCSCPRWQPCSTGYLFSPDTCECVATLTHMEAGGLPLALILVVAVFSGVGVVSGLMVLRKVNSRQARRESLAPMWRGRLEEDEEEDELYGQ